MNKNILIIIIILIFLSGLASVHAADLNGTEELNLNQNEIQELTVPLETNSQEDNNVLTSDLQINDSDVLASSSKNGSSSSNDIDSSPYLILDNDGDKENIYVGDYETWTISVLNAGRGIAKNVKVFIQLPDGLKYIKHTSTKGIFNPKTGIWKIGNLSLDDDCVYLNIVTLATSVGEKINKAQLTCDSDNLNNETYEEEEIDVFDSEKVSSEKVYKNSIIHQNTIKTTGNPLFLVLLSLFGCFIGLIKRY